MDSYKTSDLRTAIDGFYTRFQELKADILSLISEEARETNLDYKRTKLEAAAKKIATMREEFKAALVYLPAYDQKSYQEGIRELEKSYGSGLQRLQPTPKFSFKKRGLLNSPGQGTSPVGAASISTPARQGVVTPPGSEVKDDSIRISAHQSKFLELKDFTRGSEDLTSKSVQLSKLDGCVINLFAQQPVATLYLDDLTNCIVFAPPIANSVLINNCRGCLFFLACHQFRMHTTRDTKIILHVSSNPIIEDCQQVSFGPYHIRHPQLKELTEKSGLPLEPACNRYSSVEDFNWLKQAASPNWQMLSQESQERLSAVDVEATLRHLTREPLPNQAMESLLKPAEY